MSTTNNQSIQQINTAALRGTREAHQPDDFQLQQHLTKGKNMNADQFAAEIKRLRDAFDNSTREGAQLCDELAIRADIAEAAAKLAHMLCLVAGLDAEEIEIEEE